MRSSLAAGLIFLGILAAPARPVHAMQFEPTQVSSTELVMDGRGPIVPGDTDRLTRALAGLPRIGGTLLALALDSAGGNVAEAKQMVDVIRAHQLPVVVPSNGQCASACFLLFAASPRRFAATDALVGVHSANQDGAETNTSLAVTTLMARDAADLGVPASIIGKMVETTPGRVAWLDPHDLSLMRVTVYNGDALGALRQPDPAQVRRDMPASTAFSSSPLPAARAGSSSGVTAGRDDHRAWDAWLGGLQGAYRDGAVFAQTQMYETRPGLCYGPNNLNRGDFTLGCDVARQRLAPVVAKLRASADYATGWNAPVAPISTREIVEQEYRGVYFCARQVMRLTLKMFQASDETHRRGLFTFGPNDNSRNVPQGSFMVEGSIGMDGGQMTLTPLKWVLQPPGYSWFGLIGGSEDGGKTFSGRLTDSGTCTRFTLARIPASTAFR
ncbi:ATP-dependent Clp protease proteolytic subunit [Acidisphaera sp. S103]|uniref:ATP-dependent Clp protease proteolytic subunit n=1 Tax=Acidisphaera sp. S103 TaxID=1747223 RepID=UPI00131E8259|nr:ATP-dependent Clp protease proteolytic subunit [Acidisphaera sp. S103]